MIIVKLVIALNFVKLISPLILITTKSMLKAHLLLRQLFDFNFTQKVTFTILILGLSLSFAEQKMVLYCSFQLSKIDLLHKQLSTISLIEYQIKQQRQQILTQQRGLSMTQQACSQQIDLKEASYQLMSQQLQIVFHQKQLAMRSSLKTLILVIFLECHLMLHALCCETSLFLGFQVWEYYLKVAHCPFVT